MGGKLLRSEMRERGRERNIHRVDTANHCLVFSLLVVGEALLPDYREGKVTLVDYDDEERR